MALGRITRSLDFDYTIPGLEKAVGEVLRDLRDRNGLSQQELATETGLGRTYISLLERGLRRPSLETVFRLAHVLGTPPGEFVQAVDRKLQPRLKG